MRLNPKAYKLADGYTPIETQEFDGRIVEIYNMDDFDMLYNQNVPKGKFVLWTSENGKDYRLFIEKGFHNEVKELYTAQINKIWLDFWDQCDDVSKKFNFRILLPLCLVCIVLYIIISLINAIASFAIYLKIGILAIFIIGMIVLNRLTKNKIADLNKSSVALIKESLTEEGFENVLERQRTYIDDFFEAKQKEINEFKQKIDMDFIKEIANVMEVHTLLLNHDTKSGILNGYCSSKGGVKLVGSCNGSYLHLIRNGIGETSATLEVGGRNIREDKLALILDTETLTYSLSQDRVNDEMPYEIGIIRNFIIKKIDHFWIIIINSC